MRWRSRSWSAHSLSWETVHALEGGTHFMRNRSDPLGAHSLSWEIVHTQQGGTHSMKNRSGPQGAHSLTWETVPVLQGAPILWEPSRVLGFGTESSMWISWCWVLALNLVCESAHAGFLSWNLWANQPVQIFRADSSERVSAYEYLEWLSCLCRD